MGRSFTMFLAVCIAVTLAGGVATAASKSQPGAKACVNSTHVLRLLDKHDKCSKGYHAVTLGSKGPKGPRGPAGPSATFFTQNSTGGSLSAALPSPEIASLAVPAGSYQIAATVNVSSTGSNPYFAGCTLTAGTGSSPTGRVLADGQGDGMIPLSLAHSFTKPGTIDLDCGDSITQPSQWVSLTVDAIRVGSITVS